MILIVTNKLDRHADLIIGKLRQLNSECLRLNTEDVPHEAAVEFFVPASENSRLRVGRRQVTLREVRAVWYRKPEPLRLHAELDPRFADFAAFQYRALMRGLWLLLRDCLWISRPDRIHEAEDKIAQLTLARDLGFLIPDTLITNDPESAKSFVRRLGSQHGECVSKVLASSPSIAVYTEKISPTDLLDIGSMQYAPCVLQEYIAKNVEIRVTVVNGTVFAAEIHSQRSKKTEIDWRHYDFENVPHAPHILPPEVTAGCAELVARMDLRFGAIDLILTPAGEYVFLELNPNGQWLWIEHLTGLPISDALAGVLASADAAKPE